MAAQVIPPCSTTPPADPSSADATDCILQEITAVGQCLEVMELKMSDLSAASTSIRADIARFQVMVTDLDQRLMTAKDHIAAMPVQDTEMRAKITDLEDRSRRDNIRFLVYWNTRKAQISRPFLKTSFLNSQAWISPRRWSFKGPTELVLYIKQPLDGLVPSSHASSAMSRPAKLFLRPDLEARAP
ncbi:hypothetical protein NDU88_004873 [Pleurodeles waltl]|uniref:Uncharacterized protein n=1 Tax=Pleurodeles waltl TaxID=8319 RepID=A0AAV7PE35_PLEWA|nr:hypothetical protein NDU88_004873 [Pleurodeles waltl]